MEEEEEGDVGRAVGGSKNESEAAGCAEEEEEEEEAEEAEEGKWERKSDAGCPS